MGKPYGTPISGKKLHNFLLDHDIRRNELDRKLGVSKGYTSKLISTTASMSPTLYRVMCQKLNVHEGYFKTQNPEPHVAYPGMGRHKIVELVKDTTTLDASLETVVRVLSTIERDLITLQGQQDQIIQMLGTVFVKGGDSR